MQISKSYCVTAYFPLHPSALLFTFAIEMEETQRGESVQQWNTRAVEDFLPVLLGKIFSAILRLVLSHTPPRGWCRDVLNKRGEGLRRTGGFKFV